MQSILRKFSPLSLAAIMAVTTKRSLCSSPTTPTKHTKYPRLETPFLELQTKLIEIERLNSVLNVIRWDEMVMMTPGSANSRNYQKSALSGVIYEKSTSPELQKLIETLTQKHNFDLIDDEYVRANIRDADRDYRIAVGKTKAQTMREADLEGRGYQAWVEARSTNDYSKFQPLLAEVVALKKEIVASTHPNFSSYDGSLDQFERGMTTIRLNDILLSTKEKLIPFIQKVCRSDHRKHYIIPDALKGGDEWNVETQAAMCREVAAAIGFDFNMGRLDVSVHPFTMGFHPTG
jgi:carboxypeptidase Taq